MANDRRCGLIGDGVADDTEALQRLLDARAELPPGVYRVTRALRVCDEPVDVASYGGRGDGVTDNLEPFRLAIAETERRAGRR